MRASDAAPQQCITAATVAPVLPIILADELVDQVAQAHLVRVTRDAANLEDISGPALGKHPMRTDTVSVQHLDRFGMLEQSKTGPSVQLQHTAGRRFSRGRHPCLPNLRLTGV